MKAASAEAFEVDRFTGASGRYASGMVRVARLTNTAQPITETLATAIAMVILWVGARQVQAGVLDASALIAFLVIVMRMLQPLKQLSQVQAMAQQSLAAAARVFEVIDHPVEQDTGRTEVTTFRGEIVFDRVGFAYDDAPVLQDISFTARRGDLVALVGPKMCIRDSRGAFPGPGTGA